MLDLVLIILSIVVIFFLAAAFVFLGWPILFQGAPFMPSYRKNNRRILKLIIEIAQTAPGRKFVDIGSGDGRVVIEFAQAGFETTGIELNPFLVWWSRKKIKSQKSNIKNTRIIRANFWNFDFSGFDVVYVFQLNRVNALLGEKLKRELKPGAIIISAGFPFWNFELVKKEGLFWVYRK